MHSIKRSLLLFICIIPGLNALAQFVNYGADPARYKWNIVHTPGYKIIYPQGIDSLAYRYAQLLEATGPYVQQTIGQSRKWKYPVVLHPGNMLSNGMVAWAPRRMELLTTPSHDNSAQTWDSHLVLHESRHAFQTRKFMQGVFYPLYHVFGEQVSGISNFGVPTWFLEGDAVATETALSGTGRGRLPEFSMIYRAQMEAGKFYSFDKWFLGSYKDYIGTKYALGYNMTAYARHQYGADIWDKVTTRYIKNILNIPPFTKALKHHAGIGKQELFEQTFDFLQQEWNGLDSIYHQSGFTPRYLLPETKQYTTYKHPQAINDSTIIALKTSLSDLAQLVKIVNGKESRITYVGNVNSKLVYRNGRIFWTEYVAGLRWTHENYSVLKYYDIAQERIINVTPHKRYLAPAINNSGEIAALSEVSEAGVNKVVLVNIEGGQKLKEFNTPNNSFVKDITLGEEHQLFITSVGEKGMTIYQLNTEDENWSEVLAPTRANINTGFWHDGHLFFESGMNGTNNIYCVNTRNRKTYRLTTSRFGAFTPALTADKSRLLFADYQKSGYRLADVSVDSLKRIPANFDQPYRFALAESISRQEAFNADTMQLKEIEFTPKRYNRLRNLIKIHSWAPVFYDVSAIINMDMDDFSTIIKPGAMILSQNSLNTAITQLGWYYKDRNHYGKLAFTYLGWYPVIDLNVTYGGDAFDLGWQLIEDEEHLAYSFPGRNLIQAEGRIYIPFNLTKNHYVRGIQPSLTYYYTNNRIQQQSNKKFSDFQYLMPELRIYSYRKMAIRDILPKWGYQLRLQHLSPLSTGDLYGQLYAARLTSYLPGFFANNSLMIRLGYQYQNVDNKTMYLPKQIISAPRGYSYIYSTRQLVDFKADYAFPISYPDWSIGSMAYIKRLRGNIFFDYYGNQANTTANWGSASSAGADFIIDWHGLQTEFPISTGVRLIKPFEKDGLQGELLISVSF